MGNGWADWDAPRPVRERPRLAGAQTVRYCPRCDTQTVWTLGGNQEHPMLQACGCGVTIATELDLAELGRVGRHYRLATGDLDDMVGLPAPMRI